MGVFAVILNNFIWSLPNKINGGPSIQGILQYTNDHPWTKDLATITSNSGNQKESLLSEDSQMVISRTIDLITFVYGKDANLYRDVLRIRPEAPDKEIRSAFTQRRYEVFKELQIASVSDSVNKKMVDLDGNPISLTRKEFVEKKMDALIATYRLLSDAEKRRQYNMSLSLTSEVKLKQHMRKLASPQGVDEVTTSPPTHFSHAVYRRKYDDQINQGNKMTSPLVTSTIQKQNGLRTKDNIASASARPVEQFKDSPAISTPCNSRPFAYREGNESESSNDIDDLNDSRLVYTSYNPNKGPSPTKRKPYLVAKKRLFDTPGVSMSGESREASSGLNSLAPKDDMRDNISLDSYIDSEDDISGDEEFTDNEIDEEEYDDEAQDEVEGFFKEQKNPSPRSYHTPVQDSSTKSTEQITWSNIIKDNNPQENEDSEQCQEEAGLASWLRSNHFTGTATVVEGVGEELSGAASDFMLSFTQILNAFTIDDAAIDIVAGEIGDAAKDLQRPRIRFIS